MKRWFPVIGLILTLLVSGCATVGVDQRVANLEAKMEKVEKQVKIGLATGSGANFYPARSIDGGASGDLDAIDGSTLAAGDVGFVALTEDTLYGDSVFIYVYTDFGTSVSESLPYRVKPDTNPSANFAWELAFSSVAVPKLLTGGATLTIGETRAGVVHITAAGTIVIPKASTVGYGTMLCVYVDDASETAVINPDDADIIVLNGTLLSAGDSVSSPGTAGDHICLVATADVNDGSNTDGWIVMSMGLTDWTDTN